MTIRREITEFAEEIQRRERENDSRTTRRKTAFQEALDYSIAETRRHYREQVAAMFGVPVTTARKGYDYAVVDDPLEIVIELCGCATYLGRAIRTCGHLYVPAPR